MVPAFPCGVSSVSRWNWPASSSSTITRLACWPPSPSTWRSGPAGGGVQALSRIGRGSPSAEPAPAEVEPAFSAVRRAVVPGRPPRLAAKPLIDAMLWSVLPVARPQTPVQFHTGFGDPDLDLRLADPLHLRPLFEASALRGLRVVCLHCSRRPRGGYLASVSLGPTSTLDSPCPIRACTPCAWHCTRRCTWPHHQGTASTDAERTPETFCWPRAGDVGPRAGHGGDASADANCRQTKRRRPASRILFEKPPTSTSGARSRAERAVPSTIRTSDNEPSAEASLALSGR